MNLKKILCGVMLIPALVVTGCKKDDGDIKLTKADYIEAFNSVTSTYSSYFSGVEASALSASISDEDFVPANNDSQAKNMAKASLAMIYFVKGIFNNESYTIKNGADDCFVDDGSDIYDIKFSVGYDSKKSLITVDVVSDYRDSASLQYFVFEINYNFDSEKLNSFTILGFSGSDTNKIPASVRYYKFENNSLSQLSQQAEGFIPFAEGVIADMEALLATEEEANPEDYSAEYIAAMMAAFN